MKHITFTLPKHPYAFQGGDTHVSRVIMEAAQESCAVSAIALWSGPEVGGQVPVTVIRKPPARIKNLLARSVRHGCSMVHARFLSQELVEALRQDQADAVVAEHTYMAEAARRADKGTEDLYINVHVLESQVIERRDDLPRGIRGFEAARTARDEVNCIEAARHTVCFSNDEVSHLSRKVSQDKVSMMAMLLPPAEMTMTPRSPTAVFVGDRFWPPNRSAYDRLLELWPGIAADVPNAQLIIAGRGDRPPTRRVDTGVQHVGFVANLTELWKRARVLLAPVTVGGGIRVKVLDAARHGVPVVGTSAAIGGISEYLPVRPVVSDDEFRERAVQLMRDDKSFDSESDAVHTTVECLWRRGFLHEQVKRWLEI